MKKCAFRVTAFVFAVLILFLSGCSGDSEKLFTDKNGENSADISIFSYKEDTFCPILSNNEANIRMLMIVYEGLVSLNDKLLPEACLAESWSVSNGGLTWNLKLRENALWHSGADFTAEDVLYTVEQIKANENTVYSHNVANIEKISSNGKYNIKITLKKPSANFINLLYFPIIKKTEGDIKATEFRPDGTGPFRFEDKNEGNAYYLINNKKWWGGYTEEKTIKVRILPGGDTALYAFRTGSIDLVPTENMDWGKFVDPITASYTSVKTPIYSFLGINHNDKLLSLTEIRTAISHAVDREKLVENAMMGYAEATNSPIRKNWFVRGEQKFSYKQNTSFAQKNLEENGWKLDGNVYKKVIDGVEERAEFNILINSENTARENIARILADNLIEVGVKANVVRASYEEYDQKIKSGEYDAFVGSVVLSPDLEFNALFGEGNMFGFTDEEFSYVMSDMQTKVTDDDVKAAYAEFINLFEQLNPVVGLFFEDTVLIYSKKIDEEGIKPSYFDMYKGIENMQKGAA